MEIANKGYEVFQIKVWLGSCPYTAVNKILEMYRYRALTSLKDFFLLITDTKNV